MDVLIWLRKTMRQTIPLSVAASCFYLVSRHAGRAWLGNLVSVASVKADKDKIVCFVWCRSGNTEQSQSTQHFSVPFDEITNLTQEVK